LRIAVQIAAIEDDVGRRREIARPPPIITRLVRNWPFGPDLDADETVAVHRRE